MGEYRRHNDQGQVLGAGPLWLTRRMQWIREQRQHIDVGGFGRRWPSTSSAHRKSGRPR